MTLNDAYQHSFRALICQPLLSCLLNRICRTHFLIVHHQTDFDYLVPCLSFGSYKVYAVGDMYSFPSFEPVSCVKIFNISSLPIGMVYKKEQQDKLQLAWREPNCTKCEAQNKFCRLKKNFNVSDFELQCLDIPKTNDKGMVYIYYYHGPSLYV